MSPDPTTAGTRIKGLLGYRRIPFHAGHYAHLLEFDAGQFSADAYVEAGIDRPASVARAVARRQAEFLFGRLGARLALEEYGIPRAHVGIGPLREPVWPQGFIGSISHTRSDAVVAVLPRAGLQGIGLDIETAIAPDTRRDIERSVLNASERALLGSSTGLPYELLLALAFSAKESFYKAVSRDAGGFFGFEAMQIDRIDVLAGELHFTLSQSVSPAWQRGASGAVRFARLKEETMMTSFCW